MLSIHVRCFLPSFLLYHIVDILFLVLSNPTLISSNIIQPSSLPIQHPKSPPPPLSSVESLLHGTSDVDRNDQQSNESPIAQVRSSVEKQMNQLQQELLLGFPNTPTTRVRIMEGFLISYFSSD